MINYVERGVGPEVLCYFTGDDVNGTFKLLDALRYLVGILAVVFVFVFAMFSLQQIEFYKAGKNHPEGEYTESVTGSGGIHFITKAERKRLDQISYAALCLGGIVAILAVVLKVCENRFKRFRVQESKQQPFP